MDIKQIKSLMEQFDESSLSKLKITQKDFKVEFEKAVLAPTIETVAPAQTTTSAAQQAAAPQESQTNSNATYILSPMVGTFYSSPSPDSPPFIQAGDSVKKGQTIAILEAMKIMNEIEAEFDFKVLETLPSDGQAVEYDMPLFSIEKL